MTKDEALKLALDWLELGNFVYPTELRTAIKEALAQTITEEHIAKVTSDIDLAVNKALALAGEPVTWGVDWSKDGDIPCVSIIKRLPDGGIEVLAVEYGPPRPWAGLTPTDIEDLSAEWWEPNENQMALISWVEARLKEKNT